MPDLTEQDPLVDSQVRRQRGEDTRLRVESGHLVVRGERLAIGDNIKQFRLLLNLRRGRAERLTKRIHVFFCALAAARVYRTDGWLWIHELAKLDNWSGAVAKLVAN